MLTTIEQATQNFCLHQIHTDCTLQEEISRESMFIAYIDIQTLQDQTYRVYLGADIGLVQKVSQLFLEEDESDEETLIDMLLEMANLIIGSAKVIAEEGNYNSYTIQTPHFEKIGVFDFKYDDAKAFTIGPNEIILAIKELHA